MGTQAAPSAVWAWLERSPLAWGRCPSASPAAPPMLMFCMSDSRSCMPSDSCSAKAAAGRGLDIFCACMACRVVVLRLLSPR